MKTNALSVANYFIDLAKADNKPLRLLGLVKRVYIAHGFSLALADRGLLDERFDHVEAWKYGPVIPSVYHSFKQYRADPIEEKTVVMELDDKGEPIFPTPTLKDRDTISQQMRYGGALSIAFFHATQKALPTRHGQAGHHPKPISSLKEEETPKQNYET